MLAEVELHHTGRGQINHPFVWAFHAVDGSGYAECSQYLAIHVEQWWRGRQSGCGSGAPGGEPRDTEGDRLTAPSFRANLQLVTIDGLPEITVPALGFEFPL